MSWARPSISSDDVASRGEQCAIDLVLLQRGEQ
jgi:hypothetical protein